MADYYILKVLHAELEELWKNRPIYLKLSKDLDFYVQVELGSVLQRTSVVSSMTPTWDDSFPLRTALAGDALPSVATIKVKHVAALDTNIGYGQLDISEKGEETKIFLFRSKDSKSTESSSLIYLSLRSSDVTQNAGLALENLVRELVGSTTEDFLAEVDRIVNEGKTIMRDDLVRSWKSIPFVDAFFATVDLLADVNPYLRLGWKVLSVIYKVKSQLDKLDKRIHELAQELVNLFRVVADISRVRDPVESFKQAIIDLLDFTTECSVSLRENIRRSFLGRALKQDGETVLDDYEARVKNLRARLDTSISVQNGNTIANIANDTLLLKLKTLLNPSYMPGAGRLECLAGTRIVIRKQIFDWINDIQRPNMLFVMGGAGTGKSTIATTIAEEYRRKGQLVSHLFFTRGSSDPNTVFQTIAYSLSTQNAFIAEAINAELQRCGDLNSATLGSRFEILLRRPLCFATDRVERPILIILDALDECGAPQSRRQLLKIIKNELFKLPPKYRFLLTGRPEEDIASLNSISREQTIILDQRSDESRQDVSAYINHEFEELKTSGLLKIPDDCPWQCSIEILADAADGLFIWASTAVKFVTEKKLNRYTRFSQLVRDAKILDLSALYVTVLEQSLDWDEDTRHIFTSVFSLVFLSKALLSDTDIDNILGLERNTTADLLSCLRSLIVYEPGQPIKIHHASLYDYLVSCESRAWYIDIGCQKVKIATKCFDLMRNSLRFNICNLESSLIPNRRIAGLEERIRNSIPTYLQYVCCNWIHHLQDVPYSLEMRDRLETFASSQMLFWFEVLSLTETFNSHFGITLEYAIIWLGDKDPELSTFLRDAYRQASIFSKPISESAPHIYSTLLPLTKDISVFSKSYAKYMDSTTRIEYIGERPRISCIKEINVNSSVNSISYSPNGALVVAGLRNGSIHIYDTVSGTIAIGPIEGHTSNVLSVAFSHDSRLVVSGSWDGMICIWDASTGKLLRKLSNNYEGGINEVSFSPDGRIIASASEDKNVSLWVTENGQLNGNPLEGHTTVVNSVSFSPDGLHLVSGAHDGSIIVWDLRSKKMKNGPFTGHIYSVRSVSFSRNGELVVSASLDGAICIWKAFTGEIIRTLVEDGVGLALKAEFSPDGSRILAGYYNGVIRLWSATSTSEPPKRYIKHKSKTWSVSFAPDGERFASGSGDKTIVMWDVASEVGTKMIDKPKQFLSITVSSSGKYVASGSTEGTVYVWNATSGKLVNESQKGLANKIRSVSFSPDEIFVAYGSDDHAVRLWNIVNDESITFHGHTGWVMSVDYSSNGKHIVSGSFDNTIRVWDTDNGQLALEPLKGHTGWIWSVACSPDGKKIASGSNDKTIRIWNIDDGQVISILQGHSHPVSSVAFSHDGLYIASASYDTTIRVWDAGNGELTCGPISGHGSGVTSVCFSLDGKWILSGSDDTHIRIWDSLTGDLQFGPYRGHTAHINSVSFFPGSSKFVSASLDGAIRIWSMDDVSWYLNREGWILGKGDDLLLWLPHDYRNMLHTPGTIKILNQPFHARLYFTEGIKGDSWKGQDSFT